jgi:hypothetical protein
MMLFERGAQLIGLRCLGHLGQGFVDLLLGVVYILEGIEKKRVEILVGHVCSPGPGKRFVFANTWL